MDVFTRIAEEESIYVMDSVLKVIQQTATMWKGHCGQSGGGTVIQFVSEDGILADLETEPLQ